MTAPRDLGPDFRGWMDDVPPMPPELPVRTLHQTRQTRQRRRWLWFLPGPKPTARADGEHRQPHQRDSETRPRGLVPAHMGGTTTMLSATKLVSLAAVTALVGSVMLVAGPLSMERSSEQANVVDGPNEVVDGPSEVAAVHGTIKLIGDADVPATEHYDWGAALEWQMAFEFDVDEPRLRGGGRMRMNEYDIKGLPKGPTAATYHIDNDGGSWSGEGRGYRGPDLAGYHYLLELTGHGGYDGLNAILMGDQGFYGDDLTISGLVFDGARPPIPAPAAE